MVQRERDRDKKSRECLRAAQAYVEESEALLVQSWNAVAELDAMERRERRKAPAA